MRAVRPLRIFWVLCVTTIVVTCFGNAFAQARYRVTDLGVLHSSNNLGCAMSVNDQGWTFIMSGTLPPGEQDSLTGQLLNGRGVLDIVGVKIDLGTLGGQNTWMNWGQINDLGQIVGYSETKDLDPNGEDVCLFGTHLTCRPFIWQAFQMTALKTLGGNNGQASAINLSGQIAGFAENGTVDSTCPPGTTNNYVDLGAFWKNANSKPQQLPPVGTDTDSIAFGMNELGVAVGYSGTCTTANHAVVWTNKNPTALPDLGGTGLNLAWDINAQGDVVGEIENAESTTQFAALWQNGMLTNLNTLPGDAGSLASGISPDGKIVVGSTWDSTLDWSHAFIYENGVMTDLNTLLPGNSNLFAVMGNKINALGQISGMAIVRSGPDKGNIHAFLATPTNQSMGLSVADVAPTRPSSNLPARVGGQLLRRFGPGHFVQHADPTMLPLQP